MAYDALRRLEEAVRELGVRIEALESQGGFEGDLGSAQVPAKIEEQLRVITLEINAIRSRIESKGRNASGG